MLLNISAFVPKLIKLNHRMICMQLMRVYKAGKSCNQLVANSAMKIPSQFT